MLCGPNEGGLMLPSKRNRRGSAWRSSKNGWKLSSCMPRVWVRCSASGTPVRMSALQGVDGEDIVILPNRSRRREMEEILSVRLSETAEFGFEELEERLESALLWNAEGGVLEPCVWACECFSVRLS